MKRQRNASPGSMVSYQNGANNGNSSGGGGYNRGPYSNGGGGGGRQNLDQESLAALVKTGQRSSTSFKEAWHNYCEVHGHSFFDPNRQTPDFIAKFLDTIANGYLNGGGRIGGGVGAYGGGARGAPGGYRNNTAPTNPQQGKDSVVEMVKSGQRSDAEWKEGWNAWCEERGGINNPAKHEPISLMAFVLKYGLDRVVAADWAQAYLVQLGELAKPLMVKAVKRGQAQSEEWKNAWGEFADGRANGMRDPNRHEAGSLMEFFDTIAFPQFQTEPWMSGFLTGEADANRDSQS